MSDHHHDHDPNCCGHTHPHDGHTHTHDGHDNDHSHENDTYYIDQLCMVGLSGSFGMIALSLYFWQTQMLNNLLGPQFHLFILASGVALTLIAFVRGYVLWSQANPPAAQPIGLPMTEEPHTHDHDHAVQHHEHGLPIHIHHHHDHDAADHDHGWAPWRYVVLLVPIVLFLLGLPNKGPEVRGTEVTIDTAEEAKSYAAIIGLGDSPLNFMGRVLAIYHEQGDGKVYSIDYKTLSAAATSEDQRSYWNQKSIEVRGQYSPDRKNSRIFSLVRFRISCCAADSIRLDVPIVSRDEIRDIPAGQWVKVTGRVEFHERDGTFQTVIRVVGGLAKIEKCEPDNNPYIQ